MKFLTAIILSLSLLVSSSFAVSLNAPLPLVLKMQEDRSMAASDFTTEETPENNSNPLKFVVGIYSIGFCFFGLLWAGLGFEKLYDEDYQDKAGAMIGGGLGMAALGGLGIYWAF